MSFVKYTNFMNKTLIAVVVVVIVAAAGYFILSANKSAAPATSQTQTQITPSSSEATQPTSSPSGTIAEENSVTLTSSGFSPATLTVKAGAKVTWTNKSGGAAIIASNPHPTHTDYPPLNLGTFQDGGTLSLTFNKAGTYGYHNHLDPSQTGTIVVK